MTISIKSIASSSKGNCYLLDDGKTKLLLECGIPIKKIRQGVDFDLAGVSGCLITHEHKDHCKGLDGLLKAGIDCYMSEGTLVNTLCQRPSKEIVPHRAKTILAKRKFTVGSWSILPFDTIHDCAEPLGFLLQSGNDKVLFCTDSAYIKYVFNGLTHVMVECNYDMEIVRRNIDKGSMAPAQKNRLLKSHFGLDNVKDFIRANDMSKVKEIHLLHLSNDNSDAVMFEREIKKISGVPVYVAPE